MRPFFAGLAAPAHSFQPLRRRLRSISASISNGLGDGRLLRCVSLRCSSRLGSDRRLSPSWRQRCSTVGGLLGSRGGLLGLCHRFLGRRDSRRFAALHLVALLGLGDFGFGLRSRAPRPQASGASRVSAVAAASDVSDVVGFGASVSPSPSLPAQKAPAAPLQPFFAAPAPAGSASGLVISATRAASSRTKGSSIRDSTLPPPSI